MVFSVKKCIRAVLLLALFFHGVNYYLKWKTYSISAKDFKELALKSTSEKNDPNALSKIVSGLRQRYHEKIPKQLSWIPLTAGGLQLRAMFLYGELTEYVIVLAAPGKTIGRSGLHWSNNTCTVLSGEVTRSADASNEMPIEKVIEGSNFRHGQFESYIYEFEKGTQVVCYGRGFVPASGIWASAGATANADPLSLSKLYISYGRMVLENSVLRPAAFFVEKMKDALQSKIDNVKDRETKSEL